MPQLSVKINSEVNKKKEYTMPPISKSGFVLGALLAAAAAAVKIVVLDELDRRAGRVAS